MKALRTVMTLLTVTTTAFVLLPPAAASTQVGTAAGRFLNFRGDETTTYELLKPDQVTLGKGDRTTRLSFAGGPFPCIMGDAFPIGVLTLFNGATACGTDALRFDLEVLLELADAGHQQIRVPLKYEPTPNGSAPTPEAAADTLRLRDVVAKFRPVIDGREHVLTLGFGEGTAGSLPEPDRFRVFEGQTASVLLLATLTPVGEREASILNKPAADWTTTDLDGNKHSLAGHRGKVIVLDFWYRGCGWCIKAMPQIKEVTEHFRDRPVVVLGMNTARKEEDARFVAKTLKLNYATLKAAGVPEKYGVQAFPTLIIIDTEGIVRDRHVGYSPNLLEELIETISGLLPQIPPS